MARYLKTTKNNGEVSATIYYNDTSLEFMKHFIESQRLGVTEELTKEEYNKLVNPNNLVDKSDFYVIVSDSLNEENVIVYLLMTKDGNMLQSNLYDASKFASRELAEKQLDIVDKEFGDNIFDIIPVNQLIFGVMSKHVVKG